MFLSEAKARPRDIISYSLDLPKQKHKDRQAIHHQAPFHYIPLDTPAMPADYIHILCFSCLRSCLADLLSALSAQEGEG